MNWVDISLVVVLALFAWAGWRRGFIAGVFSLAGFLGGGLLAAYVLPDVIERFLEPGLLSAIAVVIAVVVAAMIGQAIASILGRSLKRGLSWTPVRFVDAVLGLGLNVLVYVLLTWLIAMAVGFVPRTGLTSAVHESRVLVTLDQLVPNEARDTFVDMRDAITGTAMPRVFAGIGELIGPEVDAPDPATTDEPALAEAREAVVRIAGRAEQCAASVTGSGFVVSSDYVLTNAHVVAGVDEITVQIARGEPPYDATVVAFDPKLDAAVLHVPGLDPAPLGFALADAESGDDAIVAGFPDGGDFEASAARVRGLVTARGEDIYGRAGVEREVIAFRGLVRPGNSGGPLLTPKGRVLGMVFGAGVSNEDTGFAITAEELDAILEEGIGRTDPVANGSCRIRD